MPLLKLTDIGKIYVSEGNVAVGIRGVNLEFDRGDFVAVTGASGSGKSTLLNVISGIDTYEEGELYIEGNATSYYSQADWEEYRQKYISFIFQDYNIIDSFTVLENVELALMYMEDPKARRARAISLIERVGLKKYMRQKGSKLSGGQKQRTVIARALAKDSPIILADEPTGNLDSTSAKEIVELLQEVSRDKLLIMVTHNFEQVESIATRHIRIYDGAVESDQRLSDAFSVNTFSEPVPTDHKAKQRKVSSLRQGFLLGLSEFKAKPLMSVFLCLFMTLGALGIFAVTSLCNFSSLFEKHYMFSYYEGRVIITPSESRSITDKELKKAAEETGAETYLRYDYLLDQTTYDSWNNPYQMRDKSLTVTEENLYRINYYTFAYTFDLNVGSPDLGRYPEADNEVLVYLPISEQEVFGKDEILVHELLMGKAYTITVSADTPVFTVCGIKYYYDNTQTGKLIFTRSGFFKLSENEGADETGYSQSSLFYGSQKEAKAAVSALKEAGYIAVLSDATYEPEVLETILSTLGSLGLMVGWALAVLFLSFFVNLCTGRSVESLRSDMAILRSMGITVKSIRTSVYVRMGLALIPAYILLLAGAYYVFTSPVLNNIFTYIPWYGYLIIMLGLLLMTLWVTKRQLKKLFKTSVKKSLTGGEVQ